MTIAIPDTAARKETVTWIRSEFERNRRISDVVILPLLHIAALRNLYVQDAIQDKLTSGRRELKQFLPSMSLHASRT